MKSLAKISNRNHLLIALTLSIVLSIILTFPSVLSAGTKFIGDGYDNYEYASYQGLAAQFVRQWQFPFHYSTYWRYPVGFDFARGFDSYITVLLGMLLFFVVGFPLAYNLTIYILMI